MLIVLIKDIMEEKAIKDRIIKRAYRNRPLTEQDKKHIHILVFAVQWKGFSVYLLLWP